MATIYMGTTKIEASRTVGEIQERLAMAGAVDIRIRYDNAEPSAVGFGIEIDGSVVGFWLPANIDPVYRLIRKSRKRARSDGELSDRQQARRTAWRILLRWIESQLALIETGMVEMPEVFLPYVATDNAGGTFYQRLKQSNFRGLPNHGNNE